MEDSLLALLPVVLMVVFLLMYFCRYANTLEKCFSLKLLNCLRRRHENRRGSQNCLAHPDNRFLRGELTMSGNHQRHGHTNSTDQDEAFILLKGQITRMVLAESEAMRLAKTLFENNEFAAKECIANLRMNLFPNVSVNSRYTGEPEYTISHHQNQIEPTINNREVLTEHFQKTLESPPSYEDCV